jgi:hypothetical protein
MRLILVRTVEIISIGLRLTLAELTRVRKEVFPEPLGPISSIEGKVTRPDARNTTEWRKSGIEMARRMAIIRPRGEGLRRACAQSLVPAISVPGTRLFKSEGNVLQIS